MIQGPNVKPIHSAVELLPVHYYPIANTVDALGLGPLLNFLLNHGPSCFQVRQIILIIMRAPDPSWALHAF